MEAELKSVFLLFVCLTAVGCIAVSAPHSVRLARRDSAVVPQVIHVDWSPPKTDIDPEYVSAAQILLGNGLGDPRGGRFARVDMPGDPGSFPALTTGSYGWISSDGRRLTCLDGIDVVMRGHSYPADLDRTISLLMAPTSKRSWFGPGSQIGPATPGVLLVLGRADLAGRVYKRMTQERSGQLTFEQLRDTITQGCELVAVDALANRRDEEGEGASAALVRSLSVQQKQPQKTQRFIVDSRDVHIKRAIALHSDLLRRVERPKREPVDLAAIHRLDKPARIAALIDALDTVDARQVMVPGGPEFGQDPICLALIAEGGDAVPAIMDVLENDERYCRSIASRGSIGSASPCTVKMAAQTILIRIWPSSVQAYYSGTGADVPKLRDLWNKFKGLSEPERWLQGLADDKSDYRNWLNAAQHLTGPADDVRSLSSGLGIRNPNRPVSGESLRASHGSEIVQLMIKRIDEMSHARTNSTMDLFEAASAMQMGHCLVKWSPRDALPSLQVACKQALDTAAFYVKDSDIRSTIAGSFGVAIADRILLGDTTTADDFGQILLFVEPEPWFPGDRLFVPLWTMPLDRRVLAKGEEYMKRWGDTMASSDVNEALKAGGAITVEFTSSPLMAFRPFREMLVRGLKNATRSGTAKVVQLGGSGKYLQYRNDSGGMGNWTIPADESAKCRVGQEVTIEVGDQIAMNLANGALKQVPHYLPIWPEGKRKQALEALCTWLLDDRVDWLSVVKSSPFYHPDLE